MSKTPSDIQTRRAALPELMFAEDVALALGLQSASAARRAIKRGDCGAYSKVGRRIVVRRDEFMRARMAREIKPTPVVEPLPVPQPSAWARAEMKRKRTRKGA